MTMDGKFMDELGQWKWSLQRVKYKEKRERGSDKNWMKGEKESMILKESIRVRKREKDLLRSELCISSCIRVRYGLPLSIFSILSLCFSPLSVQNYFYFTSRSFLRLFWLDLDVNFFLLVALDMHINLSNKRQFFLILFIRFLSYPSLFYRFLFAMKGSKVNFPPTFYST